jgi:hypothetical protein
LDDSSAIILQKNERNITSFLTFDDKMETLQRYAFLKTYK